MYLCPPDGQIPPQEVFLYLPHGIVPVMGHGGDECRVRLPLRQHIVEMDRFSRAPGSNNGDVDLLRDHPRDIQFVAVLRPVGIDGIKDNFPCPQFFRFFCPCQGIEIGVEADESGEGPASFMITDPDGNPILIDQHR